MPSTFPSSNDSLNDHHQDNVAEVIHASDINAEADAIMAIEGDVSTTGGANRIPEEDSTGHIPGALVGSHNHTEDFIRVVTFAAPLGGDTATLGYIPANVTINTIRVLLSGGTSCAINVVKDNSVNLLASDLSSSTSGTWQSTSTIQNGALASGDWLTAKVTAQSGNPTEVCVVVEGTKSIS